jgi:hypothetical protein
MSLVESRKKGLQQNKERKEELKILHEQLRGSVGHVGDYLKRISDIRMAPIVETQVALYEGFKENQQIFTKVLSELQEMRKDINLQTSKLGDLESVLESRARPEPEQRAENISIQPRPAADNASPLHASDEHDVRVESEATPAEMELAQLEVSSVHDNRVRLRGSPFHRKQTARIVSATETTSSTTTTDTTGGQKRKRDIHSVPVENETALDLDTVAPPPTQKAVGRPKKAKTDIQTGLLSKKELQADFQKRFLDAARSTCNPKLPIKLGDCVITAMWNRGDPENADPEHIRATIEKQAEKYRTKSGIDVEVIATDVSESRSYKPIPAGQGSINEDDVLLTLARKAVQEATAEPNGRMRGKSFTEKMMQAKAKKAAERKSAHEGKEKVQAENNATEKAAKEKFIAETTSHENFTSERSAEPAKVTKGKVMKIRRVRARIPIWSRLPIHRMTS